MRTVLLVAALSSLANAAPAKPVPPNVNLLTAVPVMVAVSSTVANRAIKPEHLVDGDLGTAWNSRTGDLVGSWIAVRLPNDASVTALKLTVGFTKIDPKLGDLFTENPRIKRVRVTHDAQVIDKDLDLKSRALQEIPIVGGGGDYKIEILAVAMGTKVSWKETCISELEVWGSPGLHAPSAHPSTPFVQVATLEVPELPPTPPAIDCKELGLDGNVSVELIALGEHYAACHTVGATNPNDPFDTRRHELTLIAVPGNTMLKETVDATAQINEGLGAATDNTITTAVLELGDGEVALVVASGSSSWNNLPGDTSALPLPAIHFTVYRATKTGFTKVLETGGDAGCTLDPAPGKAPALDNLVLACKKRVRTFKWTGTKYK